MSEEETRCCPNCKREIPAVNFTIHSVHCARNIKICPVCKEPVPGSELDDHHKKMHKLLPCKQCGESVCGTDLEDHIRDSCGNTVKSCRFCELELARRELPTHEGYCGVRTEQCPDCKEYVMIKYQQLHLDSNHGFIRLDDDPAPTKKEPPRLNLCKPVSKSNLNKPSNGEYNVAQRPTSIFDEFPTLPSVDRRPPNSGFNNPSPSHNVKNRPSSTNSGLNPSTFGNPRPNRLSSSNSGPSSFNTGLGSSDSRPSSSNSRPSSSESRPSLSESRPSLSDSTPISSNSRQSLSDSRPGSSNSRPSSSSARPDSSSTRPNSSSNGLNSSNLESSPTNSVAYNTKSSYNDRLGLVFATPQPFLSPNSGPTSPNSNFQPNTSSSNTRPSSSNTRLNSSNTRPSSSNTRPSNFDIAGNNSIAPNIRNITNTEVKNQGSSNIGHGPSSNISSQETTPSVARTSGAKKRTNDQPQINMDTTATKTVDKDLGGVSRGAVKKRPAPQPPRASARRDLPYYSALQRQQREDRERRELNEYNLAHGLPPVLNPAQKVEKLRKLDALQNRDYEEEYRSRQRRPSPEQGYDQGYTLAGYQGVDEATRQEFKNLKPMSPTQFMKRFSSLQVSPPSAKSGDRFPEIKSSLRELRRGLNEVTAPYNVSNNTTYNNNDRVRSLSPVLPPANEEVQLPCEFCGMLVPADDLVQHQTGCRPDLAQLAPEAASPRAPRAPRGPPAPAPAPSDPEPGIPCEFCMRSLPVYLIIEHQERCIRENMPV